MTRAAPGALLVVIDMQHIFARGPWGAPKFDDIVPVVERLVRAHSAVTFTRFIAPDNPDGAWQAYYEMWPFALQPPDAPDYGIVDELAGYADSTVDATTFGKWPRLQEALGSSPGDRIAVCGVSTDCCVISTVLGAADAGIYVQVVADGCAGIDDQSHQKALDVMALYSPMVRIVSSADILE